MDKQIILKLLSNAMESWIRSASAAQLWQVHTAGGLGATIHAEGDALQVRVELGGPRGVMSDIGKTDGRLPVTEAFRGDSDDSAWGAPPPQDSPAREPWFLSNGVAQEHARQFLLAEVKDRRDLLERFVDDWLAAQGGVR